METMDFISENDEPLSVEQRKEFDKILKKLRTGIIKQKLQKKDKKILQMMISENAQ